MKRFAICLVVLLSAQGAWGATVTATADGLFHVGATWTGGQVPGTTDTADANGHSITMDATVTCATLTNTGGGTFSVSTFTGTRTINANLVGASVSVGDSIAVVTNTSATGTLIVYGNITGSQAGTIENDGLDNMGGGSVQVGDATHSYAITGGAGTTGAMGLYTIGGTAVLYASCTGGNGNGCHGLFIDTGGAATVYGNATASQTFSSCGIFIQSTVSPSLTLYGNSLGGTTHSSGNSACGVLFAGGVGSLIINGSVQGGTDNNPLTGSYGLGMGGASGNHPTVTINNGNGDAVLSSVAASVDYNSSPTFIITGNIKGSFVGPVSPFTVHGDMRGDLGGSFVATTATIVGNVIAGAAGTSVSCNGNCSITGNVTASSGSPAVIQNSTSATTTITGSLVFGVGTTSAATPVCPFTGKGTFVFVPGTSAAVTIGGATTSTASAQLATDQAAVLSSANKILTGNSILGQPGSLAPADPSNVKSGVPNYTPGGTNGTMRAGIIGRPGH